MYPDPRTLAFPVYPDPCTLAFLCTLHRRRAAGAKKIHLIDTRRENLCTLTFLYPSFVPVGGRLHCTLVPELFPKSAVRLYPTLYPSYFLCTRALYPNNLCTRTIPRKSGSTVPNFVPYLFSLYPNYFHCTRNLP